MRIIHAIVIFLVGLTACEIPPLRRQDLFSTPYQPPAADAASTDTASPDADRPQDGSPNEQPMACQSSSRTGILSGVVVDKCTGREIRAKVGIFCQRKCSDSGKGLYTFTQLPIGCSLTLAAYKDGYKPYDPLIVKIDESGLARVTIELERASGDCIGPPPSPDECDCPASECPGAACP